LIAQRRTRTPPTTNNVGVDLASENCLHGDQRLPVDAINRSVARLARATQPFNPDQYVSCLQKIRATETAEADREKSMSTQAWVCALAMMTTTVAGAKEPLSMKVSPAMSFAPANLVIRTRLEPDAGNRAMEVIAESDDFYRSSAIQLEGDRAPRTITFEFRSLPPGEYEVTAVVIGTDGQRRALARSAVNVMESGASR
jgi:hypothetical protein